MHIAIIGAGITGTTTARALISRGHTVTVIERERYPAMKTSFANGGQLSASNAEVWNSWATMTKGLKWMLKADAPLLVNPKPSPHKIGWMAEFAAQMPRYRDNTIATTRLAIAARDHLLRTAEEDGFGFDLEEKGILHFYHDRQTFETASKANVLINEGGLERYAVTPEEIRAIEPTLHGDFYGGFYTPSDFTGDVHKYSNGLAEACIRKGATFLMERSVSGITTGTNGVTIAMTTVKGEPLDPLFADAVVICGGVGSRKLAAMVGERVNIYPVKGYSITVHMDDTSAQAAAPRVSLLDESAKIVTSRLGDERFRIAGTAEFNGTCEDIRADRIQPLIKWAERHFPGLSTRRVVPWAGLRPMTPNMLPRVGAGKRPGVFFNTGHGHLGWTLSAITAQLTADAVDEAFPATKSVAVAQAPIAAAA